MSGLYSSTLWIDRWPLDGVNSVCNLVVLKVRQLAVHGSDVSVGDVQLWDPVVEAGTHQSQVSHHARVLYPGSDILS